jgi:hypothetical protein
MPAYEKIRTAAVFENADLGLVWGEGENRRLSENASHRWQLGGSGRRVRRVSVSPERETDWG